MTQETAASIVVMGVQGIGKSTIGRLLAQKLEVPFVDGDRLHPSRNVAMMASGRPLTDSDRAPWLEKVGKTISSHLTSGGVVVACSALKLRYRDTLRSYDPNIFFVEPFGSIELVILRIGLREHEFMPPVLLQSQFDTLEALSSKEQGLRVSVEPDPEFIIDQILAAHSAKNEEVA